MERVGDRQGKMDTYCLTSQSPQQAVALTEEEEKKEGRGEGEGEGEEKQDEEEEPRICIGRY